ncbi:MAG: hypothetical protein J6Z79_01055 [Clostridia bacterium]|nr:hypothetical protein [Clostridia bacterium]
MTRDEYTDLYDSLCYGHDADLLINGMRIFIEWNGEEIEVYEMNADKGKKLCALKGNDMFETVSLLFASTIHGKVINDDVLDIQIIDIE